MVTPEVIPVELLLLVGVCGGGGIFLAIMLATITTNYGTEVGYGLDENNNQVANKRFVMEELLSSTPRVSKALKYQQITTI